jgi:1-deoxy-D-xylulose-5-phosphate reductoisomerase
MIKRLCILGSTGSVGTNTLRVVRGLAGRFRVQSLSAGKNLDLLAEQVSEFHPSLVSVALPDRVEPLRARLAARNYSPPIRILSGAEGSAEAATDPEVDLVVSASHGVTGLAATYAAVRAGKQIGLANKESLVVAGELITRAASERSVELLPIDSEHSALHQCLRSGRGAEVRRLILTGSGGPFLKSSKKSLNTVTPEQALKHPVWKMGGRITVDSATLMNKGLEVIEAHWLFGLPSSRIEVVIHPESAVHSMIEFCDGSMMAQLAVADMRLPIQYALTYPERVAVNGDLPALDLVATRRLHFLPPDVNRFPCLELAREALEQGGAMPCVLNAADEVAVEAFLDRRLPFLAIPRVIKQVMARGWTGPFSSLEDILACDTEARTVAREVASRLRQ